MKLLSFIAGLSKNAQIIVASSAVAVVATGGVLIAVAQPTSSNDVGVSQEAPSSAASGTSGSMNSPSEEGKPGSSASPSTQSESKKSSSSASPSTSAGASPNTSNNNPVAVEPPTFINPTTYFNANCDVGCDGQIFYTNELPEASGTGPFSYSVSGIPAGVNFAPGSRTLVLNANSFWTLNECSQVEGTVWITGPFTYTATGPGGSTTIEMSMNFAVYKEEDSRCRSDLWQWYPPPV